MRTATTVILLTWLMSATRVADAQAVSDDGARRRLEATIRFLADDLLEGRGTPGRSLDLAALYLATQLRGYGWQPGNGSSFLQSYPVAEYTPHPGTVSVTIGGQALRPDEFAFMNFGTDPAASPLRLDTVFVGHALVDPERGIDELSGADLRGKAAVALGGAPWPVDASEVFGPEHAAGKSIEVTVRGARLLVEVVGDLASPRSAETDLILVQSRVPVAFLPDLRGKPSMGLGSVLAVSESAFDRTLAQASGATCAEWQKRLGSKPATPRPLSVPLELRVEATPRLSTASNVVATLRGSDPALREEWVVLTAHYDHLGTGPAEEGKDNIYNGADDNASGTAAVLEIARRLASGPPPRRSVLVLLVSGEERGLLGSAYYALQPLVPMGQVVVDINVDMVGRSQGMVQGVVETSAPLHQVAVAMGVRHDIVVQPDQHPGWRLAYLSDDYHFARNGVPAIEFFTGLHEDYHQPSDEASRIRYDELGRILEVMSDLARHYADGAPRPAYRRPAWFLVPE